MRETYKASIIVGIGKQGNGVPLASTTVERALEDIRLRMAITFGGVTVARHEGDWINASGERITEQGVTLYTYSQLTRGETECALRRLGDSLKTQLSQDCVIITIERADFAFV